MIVWITGLSGAGKSTLAAEVARRLREEGRTVMLLDGDALREVFATPSGEPHARATRLELALGYGRLCRMIAPQGIHVVIATISMFEEVYAWNRANLPGYVEVYLKTPMEELRRRDAKGLYRRHAAGRVKHVAGLDLQVDEPAADHVVAFTPGQSVAVTADHLMRVLMDKRVA